MNNHWRTPYSYVVFAWVILVMSQVHAEQVMPTRHSDDLPSVELAEVLATFLLPDSEKTDHPLWSAGDHLPILWKTASRLPTPAHLRNSGEVYREGMIRVTIHGTLTYETPDEETRLPGAWQLVLIGTPYRLQTVRVELPQLVPEFPDVEDALTEIRAQLLPYRCDTERVQNGSNVVYQLQAPGKKRAWLNEAWFCKPMGRHAGWCWVQLDVVYSQHDADMIICTDTNE